MSRRAELEEELGALEKRVLSLKKELGRIPFRVSPVGVDPERTQGKSHAHEVLFQWDKSGVCHDLQTERSVVFGRAVSEWVGKNVSDVIEPPLCEVIHAAIGTAISEQVIEVVELQQSATQDGGECYRAWLIPCVVDQVIAILYDVSLTEGLAQSCNDLLQRLGEKNQELQQFVYRVSHDLKGPLVSIKGFSQLIREDIDAGVLDEVPDHLREVVDAAETVQFLIDRILDLSRVGTATLELVSHDMEELIQGAIELESDLIEETGATIEMVKPLPHEVGDRQQLTTVFRHLISNACKYARPQTPPKIKIGVVREVDRVAWYVRDQGLGIEQADQSRVFELFERLNRPVSGAGVGLAVTKRIIELHGGRIWVESEGAGKGATFTFSLEQTRLQ